MPSPKDFKKLFETARGAEKAGEAAQDISQLTKAGKQLSLAERQYIAEMAAKQGEELARLRPADLGPVATKGKSKGPSPKPARAKPKTKAEISAIAERIAPQMLGEFVRIKPGESVSVAGKSRKQFDLERELEHDIQRSREVPEAGVIDLEPHKGSVMLSLPGDISISDYDIFGIGGEGLRAPSRQYGGPRFGLGHPEEAGWASGLVPAAKFQRLVTGASEQYGGVPVLANFMAMGPEGLNYAQHYADALLKATKPEQMTQRNIDHFNRIIRSGNLKGEFPDFPGIEHPEAAYLYMAENPEARKHYNSVMQLTKTTEELGLPSGLNVRHAVSEPELRDMERGMTGYSLMQMEPGVQGLKPSAHPTYSHDIPGQFLGRTDVLMPYELTFPDTVAGIRANPKQAGSEFGTLQMVGGKQIIDQQLLDEIGEYRRRIKELTGKKDGGPVHMAGGNEPGQSIGEMFNPKPLTIPQPLTDLSDAAKAQIERERRSMRKPGALTDILMRGPVAFAAGAPMDIIGMGGEALDWLQTKIPGLRKPASVMDTGPERTPPMGYAPKVQVGPQGTMPYGTESAQELMRRAGITTGEERPLTELGTAILAPGAAQKALKYGTAGAKALAPTPADILEMQLQRATAPMRMSMVPESGPKGKVKAPANDLGFYNPVEKAALNVQRKQGPGSAFVSEMKKTPGVNDERLTELGLGDLASRPNVTREELVAAAEQNRIPLQETVRTESNEKLDAIAESIDNLKEELQYLDSDSREYAEIERHLSTLEKEYQQAMRSGPAKFGPNAAPEYNLPGGENYREIRVGLPSNRPSINNMSRAEYNAAIERADAGDVQDFMHQTHHGDEPNVLFHLRVADHTDAEGKKGLLIDELQSDWHQQGREKGYKSKVPQISWEDPEYVAARRRATELLNEFNRNSGNPARQKEIRPLLDQATAEERRFTDLSNAYYRAVPDAPFKDNWYQLGLKRAVKEAADTGMDRVYLTTGARQADRYDLSKQVDKVVWNESTGSFAAQRANGEGTIKYENVTKDRLADYIGKDAADKIINAKEFSGWKTLEGNDLKVGGEGMRQYYDKTYKNFLDKYAKQFGAKVGETTLPAAGKGMHDLTLKQIDEITSMPGFIREMMSLSGGKSALQMSDDQYARIFNQVLRKFRPDMGEKVYYIDITPKMRESAKIGQSYKDGGAVRMAEGGAVDYESRFNQMLQDHVAGMAGGGAVDYESRFNEMLQKHVQGMAEGGEVNSYNSDPDMSDGGLFVQAPAFANGGAVKSIWTVN